MVLDWIGKLLRGSLRGRPTPPTDDHDRPVQSPRLTRLERLDLLTHEYDTISSQIIHWDQHLWRQSEFFVVVESAFVALIGKELIERSGGTGMPSVVVWVLSIGCLLNLFLCYVWFRVVRRNFEYSGVRFARAKKLEADPALQDTLRLYRLETETLSAKDKVKHGSRSWVKHIPSAFILTWLGALVAVAYETGVWPDAALPLALAGVAAVAIAIVEIR